MSLPAIMAAVGGAAGAYGGYQANKGSRRQNNAIQQNALKMQGDINDIATGRLKTLSDQYAPLVGDDFGGDTKAYYDALDNADYSQFNLSTPEDFAFDQAAETQRQLNPELQAIINRSTGEVANSSANAGKLFSGAAGKGIARATADIQAKEWDAASQRAQTERTNKYQQWTDKFKNAQTIAENNRSNMNQGLQNKGTKFGIQNAAYGQQVQGQQGIQNAQDTALLQSKQQGYDAQAANKGLSSNFMSALTGGLSAAGNIFGSFGGGK